MVYKKQGTLKEIDGLCGIVRLGKGCIHIVVPFIDCNESHVDASIKEEKEECC